MEIKRTHDGRPVHPAGSALPEGASGWTQCDNRGGGYAVWLETADQPRSRADMERLVKQASALRTRTACEAALRELGLEDCQIGGTCRAMRDLFVIVSIQKLWPLRQVEAK